jgi:C-terminal processing protease CtpA/Prc
MIVTSGFTLIFGQAPEAPQKERAPQTFAFSFDGGGSYLGVQTQEVNKENFAKFNLREVRGVAVEKVMDNSPAAQAGIQPGDVIIRFNGEEVTSARKLTRLIGEVDPDHQAKVTVIRGGTEQEITATLAKRPMPAFAEGAFKFDPKGMPEFKDMPALKDLPQFKDLPNFKGFEGLKPGEPNVFTFPNGEGRSFVWRAGEGRAIGVSVSPLTKQLADHFDVDGGALVNDVRENSPAAKAGLKAGDIIVEADGKAVKTQFDLIKAVNEKKEGSVQITVVRKGKKQSFSVTPEASKDNGFVFSNDNKDDGE